MPETYESEVVTSRDQNKRSGRTEAKFFEDVERIIAEGERLDAKFDPPNAIAKNSFLKTKRDADSPLSGCVSAKGYNLSKYKKIGQPYQNLAKTRFVVPSRLRSKALKR